MGVLLSRFRAKPSTKELLEEIQKEIDSHLEYKHTTELQQKNLIGSLIFYSVLFYIIFFSIFLYYSYPLTNKSNIIYAIPFLVFPILLYIFKRFLQWYFAQKIRRNEENLFQLRKRKKSLLEFAMETETYKIVKELLEKFDPEYQKKCVSAAAMHIFEPKPAIEASPAGLKGSFTDMDLRQRNVAQRLQSSPVAISSNSGPTLKMNSSTGSPNIFPVFQSRPPTNQPYPPAFYQRGGPRFVRPPLQQMPRPVLPRDRSLMDRLVDYLVGDGPSNRYALICRFCQSHNGMALKEEFEYVAFRCCYCFQFNPPRNQQPPPPRLTLPAATAPPAITDGISSAVSSSSEDTDVDNTNENDSSPIITPQENSSVDDSKELSSQRLSISSDTSEIQANLVEDKPYVPPESNEETDMQNEEINEEKS